MLALALALSSPAAPPANRLARESSPYLLQHAHNPVDWYPWGDEAFARAKRENKLVFLSIGYSSCHWCHVMERESFADAAIAKTLNEHFVCVKVDREERPDIDDVYMTALQALGNGGGWPLSMFLLPDGRPIVGGTYFPPADREIDGRTQVGFPNLLRIVHTSWKDDPARLTAQAEKLAGGTAAFLERNSPVLATEPLGSAEVNAGVAAIAEALDPLHGGLGRGRGDFEGPKFPMPPTLALLWSDAKLRPKLRLTLTKIADGGIRDHLAGGFHRYSTERTWTVPHFEKMLYDQAQLVELYARAFADDPEPPYREAAADALAYVAADLALPCGLWASSRDADSDGKEGAYYVWTTDELRRVFPDERDFTLFTAAYGGAGSPNFEGTAHVLRRARPLADVAAEQNLSPKQLAEQLAPLRARLLAERAKRPAPARDAKAVVAWNGLMVAGYAEAGKVFQEPGYLDTARRGADALLKLARSPDGRLARVVYPDDAGGGRPSGTAYLEDYACVVHGLLSLFAATGERRWLDAAKELDAEMHRRHADGRGGLFTTASDAPKLFARARDYRDGVTPSGNGQAALNAVRLWRLTGDDAFRERADKLVTAFRYAAENQPQGVPLILLAVGRLSSKPVLPEPPAGAPKPLARDSASVVSLGVSRTGDALTVTITPQKGWHVYANPVGSKTLGGSETTVEVWDGDAKLDAKPAYPAGDLVKDTGTGDYRVYGGATPIVVTVPGGGARPGLRVRVRVSACDERACLRPSVLTAVAE